jgi:osmotically-inducible protein OsmY
MITKTDADLQKGVLQELHWDSRVDETEVGVEVDDGVVTLSGTVENYAKKIAAQEAAHRVAGVLDVANDIEVKIPGKGKLNDTEIAKEVRDSLQWNVFVDDTKIASTVHDGYVTLDGQVDSLHAREEAAAAIRTLAGVRAVINRITVTTTKIDPSQVQTQIEEALKRRAETAAHGIHVSIDDHAVVLEGKVPSWTEKQTIIDAAGHMRGITKLVDHVNIAPLSQVESALK